MIKKITFLILIIFATLITYSQNYNISFAATGTSTIVETVKVENLTQNTTLTLNGNDILHLGPAGINESEVNSKNLQIFPNPMQEKAALSFYIEQNGNVKITISDITGKDIMHSSINCTKGNNRFLISGLKQGINFVHIKSETFSYSSKLISQNTSISKSATIEYMGFENKIPNKFKNTNTTVNMPYNDGDRLLFRGISGNYINIITDIPTSDKTITFNYTACTDVDSNNYATVQIGTQIWMAENLKTTHYKNGVAIVYPGTDYTAWLGNTSGAYTWYNNDETTYKNTYGALYNWYAIITENLCPTGWHVPGDAEWTVLTTYLGGESIAGGKLKATILWNNPNTGATNEIGFTALPAGHRSSSSSFDGIGSFGYWWSSTVYDEGKAWGRFMRFDDRNVISGIGSKPYGSSVRCIKD